MINFRASAIYKAFNNNNNNNLFLDKAYENAEGEISSDWVTTLYDSRNPEFILSESEKDASPILSSQLKGNSGFVEFMDKGENLVAAYQKINISDREWYIATVVSADSLIIDSPKMSNLENKESDIHDLDLIKVVYWFIALILLVSLVLFILYRFKVIPFEGRVIMVLLVIAALAIIILFVFNTYQVTESIKKSTMSAYQDQQMLLVKQTVREIEASLDAVVNNVIITSNDLDFLAGNKIEDHVRLKRLFKRISKYSQSINLLDSRGMFLDRVSFEEETENNCIDFSKKPGVIEVLKTGKFKISNIFENTAGKGIFSIVVPVNRSNKLEGILRINIYLDTIFDNYLSNIKGSKIKMIRLVTEKKSYGFDGSIVKTPEDVSKAIKLRKPYHAQLPSLLSSNKDSNIFLKTHYPLKVGENNWEIVLVTPLDSIYASSNSNINRIWYFTISIILSILVIALFFNFLLSSSLKKQIANKTGELKKSSELLLEQLKKEEQSSLEKESLIKQQIKTQEALGNKVEELEKFQKVTMNRELKMIELKEEIKKLKKK